MPDNSLPTFVTLAKLLRPQGRKGEMLADLFTDFPEQILADAGVFLVPVGTAVPGPDSSRVRVESQWLPLGKNAGRLVVKLATCNSISEAETLAGVSLMIPAEERPALAEDTFYITDLIGCTLINGTEPAGEIVDVEFATMPDGRTRLPDAAPLLCVRTNGSAMGDEPSLVPFVRAHLHSVDLANRLIIMHLPQGLLGDSATL